MAMKSHHVVYIYNNTKVKGLFPGPQCDVIRNPVQFTLFKQDTNLSGPGASRMKALQEVDLACLRNDDQVAPRVR